MKWHSESIRAWADRVRQWNPWFAWLPVRIGERKVWLETVERKGEIQFTAYNDPVVFWEYRELDGTARAI